MAPVTFQAPLAISSFEAHLLALLLGAVLAMGARASERGRFHVLAAAIHVVLGGSNLLFFERAFGALDMRTFGVVITACHLFFVLAQTLAALPGRRDVGRVALEDRPLCPAISGARPQDEELILGLGQNADLRAFPRPPL